MKTSKGPIPDVKAKDLKLVRVSIHMPFWCREGLMKEIKRINDDVTHLCKRNKCTLSWYISNILEDYVKDNRLLLRRK